MELSGATAAAIEEQFAEDQHDEARRVLSGTRLPMIGDNGERVHLALIKLARGDMTRLKYHFARALVDWRDVLADADQ